MTQLEVLVALAEDLEHPCGGLHPFMTPVLRDLMASSGLRHPGHRHVTLMWYTYMHTSKHSYTLNKINKYKQIKERARIRKIVDRQTKRTMSLGSTGDFGS